ncbi:MAG: VWA domain-containing protein [Calditrichaeota bacterium]|nr:VWA domain-containing protein [Calditrichota bacterium]MCB9391155.1 VWA domain-containing protein [Calditrichota bacterium]
MKFAHPEFFWLFSLLPLLVYVQFFRESRLNSDFRFPTLAHARKMGRSIRVRLRLLPFLLRLAGLSLLIIALARPQQFDTESTRSIEGIDIVLCIDISTSMDAEDLKPDRLEAAKRVAAEFVQLREHDRIGVVPFAGESFTQVPLTTDHKVVLSLLGQIQMRMVEDGTAIGMALATSVNRLRESDAKSKVIILLTDGQNNRGEIDPLTAAQAARALGLRIYTIGVGTRGMAPYPVETVFGKRYQNVQVNIDEEMLTEIANLTGGRYYRATDEKSLATIYEQIDTLERTKIQVEEYKEVAELFMPWLIAAVLCLALELLLSLTWLRKLP